MQEPSNWGRWGSDDEQGTKNLLTASAVLRACTVPTQGRVYNLGIELRRGAPFAGVRSVVSIDSRPNEQFVAATISRINDSRNRVELDVDVPTGDRHALLTFSRPYFCGYEARLGNQKLAVTSYRGLLPIVEVPAGSNGRLTLTYRPYWLKWGSAASIACVLALLLGFFAATSQRRFLRTIQR